MVKKIRRYFGDQIDIKFINIFTDNAKAIYPEIWLGIAVGNLTAPVIIVNNEPVVNGKIAVQPVIDKLLKLSLKKLR